MADDDAKKLEDKAKGGDTKARNAVNASISMLISIIIIIIISKPLNGAASGNGTRDRTEQLSS